MQADSLRPLVVQYLYLHQPGEEFRYPTVRGASSAARVATRYLECAVTQAASLRLTSAPCDLALATNIAPGGALGRMARSLSAVLALQGVQLLRTDYEHRPGEGSATYLASRFVLDAILAATEGQPPDRTLWLTDLDCVWADAARVFAATPAPGEVGCILLKYPADWDVVGFGGEGQTPRGIGELAARMGGQGAPPPWVGGELLCGTAATLRELVASCDALDRELAGIGVALPTEEQILTLAGALGRVRFRDLSGVAGRIHTGPRHSGPETRDPAAIGLWHLPAEKGLSLRRAATDLRRGRLTRLGNDLADPRLAARRFNVQGAGRRRRLRDDAWIVLNKTLDLGRRGG